MDPSVVAVGVIAAAGDDEAVVEVDLAVVLRELPARHAVHVPRLPLLRQHSHENPKIPSVRHPHVLRVLRAQQHRIPLPLHSLTRPSSSERN